MYRTYITKINGEYYAFAGNISTDNVYSIGSDNPPSGKWVARWTDGGIKYVSTPSPSRKAAYMKARRHGDYAGEV